MVPRQRPKRSRRVCPELVSLEGRALLSAGTVHPGLEGRDAALVRDAKRRDSPRDTSAGSIIATISKVKSHGYDFVNFDGPSPGTTAGEGTVINGISNSGTVVGYTIGTSGYPLNFTGNPLTRGHAETLNIENSPTATAEGINSRGTIVGTVNFSSQDMTGDAFYLSYGKLTTFAPSAGTADAVVPVGVVVGMKGAIALGINDHGTIVGYGYGDYNASFIRTSGGTYLTVSPPSGLSSDATARGINDEGLVVGSYLANGNQGVGTSGFVANEKTAKNGTVTATAVADPKIPSVPGEPGATLTNSTLVAINDHDIAVGYYTDSLGSEHGFLYNTKTGHYTFLDDPSAAFFGGAEVSEITGITNSGEITGIYSDANGVLHGFVAKPSQG
jgi:Protein of unknown function (DUF3466)